MSFFEIWGNRIFHWGWANRDEKFMKAPYRICSYPYKPEITIFGAVKRSKNAKNMFEKREKHDRKTRKTGLSKREKHAYLKRRKTPIFQSDKKPWVFR